MRTAEQVRKQKEEAKAKKAMNDYQHVENVKKSYQDKMRGEDLAYQQNIQQLVALEKQEREMVEKLNMSTDTGRTFTQIMEEKKTPAKKSLINRARI